MGLSNRGALARNGIEQYARYGKHHLTKKNGMSDNLSLMDTIMTGLIRGKVEAEVS